MNIFRNRRQNKKLSLNRGRTGCCGMDVLYGIWDNKPVDICEFVWEYYKNGFSGHTDETAIVPFIIFSASDGDNERTTNSGDYVHNGDSLARYISRNKLGKVHCSKALYNPNSGNMLKAYLWEVSAEGFTAWANDEHRRMRHRG